MKKSILFIFALSLLETLLLYHCTLGINALLMNILMIVFLFFYLKNNNLIKNKKGLLLLIPISILSITYFIYNNVFNILNIFVIPLLYILMLIFVVSPKRQIEDLLVSIVNTIIRPFDFIDSYLKESKKLVTNNKIVSQEQKRIMKSIIIVLPIVIIVLFLLSSADQMFLDLFHFLPNPFENITLGSIIGRVIMTASFFIYVGSSFLYLKKEFSKEKDVIKKIKIDEYTIQILLTILNGIYIIFDIIQVRSLWMHRLSSGINYAEYARSGFFQLMFISLINLIIILLSKKSRESNYSKWMSLIMILLTSIIIGSSFFRMFLYEQAYGYTVLRLGVYIILFTEVILLIPTIIYIFNSKLNILKYYIIIITSIYTIVNCVSIDQIIAANNIKRYERTGKIDLYYLENNNTDNLKQLINFYNHCENEKEKELLDTYFSKMKEKLQKQDIREYNLSKARAKKILKEKRN